MLSHVHIGITNFEPAFAFYRGVMDELGFTLKFSEPEKSWADWMQAGVDRSLFLIGYPYNGERAAPGNGQMVALYHLHNGLNRGIFEVSGGNCWLFLLPEV